MLDNKYVEESFSKFAKVVVSRAKANLTRLDKNVSRDLYESLDDWKVSVGRNGSVTLVFNMEDYGIFQDRGVKGADPSKSHRMRENTPYKFTNKMPPLNDLRKWVGNRGFQFRDRNTGRFKSYEATARIIQHSVYQKGIPQTLFFTKPFKSNYKNLPDDILEAFSNDVEQYLTAVFKDTARFRQG